MQTKTVECTSEDHDVFNILMRVIERNLYDGEPFQDIMFGEFAEYRLPLAMVCILILHASGAQNMREANPTLN